jgi:hypothetical protein
MRIVEGHSVVLYGLDMKISATDLRRHLRKVWQALERNEDVWIVSRGKLKGVIKPVGDNPQIKVEDHPFFGMRKSPETVKQQMDHLRGGRYRNS